MSYTKSTKIANRFGLNTEFFASTDTALQSALLTVDFANVTDVDISGDIVWATGGQGHVNKVGFGNPVEGTFKFSTQLMTGKLLALMAGNDVATATNSTTFQNTANSTPKYFIVRSQTVWQDEDGNTVSETLVFHKVCPKRALNVSYSGEGDPTSIDVEFDVMEDTANQILTVYKGDSTAASVTFVTNPASGSVVAGSTITVTPTFKDSSSATVAVPALWQVTGTGSNVESYSVTDNILSIKTKSGTTGSITAKVSDIAGGVTSTKSITVTAS